MMSSCLPQDGPGGPSRIPGGIRDRMRDRLGDRMPGRPGGGPFRPGNRGEGGPFRPGNRGERGPGGRGGRGGRGDRVPPPPEFTWERNFDGTELAEESVRIIEKTDPITK